MGKCFQHQPAFAMNTRSRIGVSRQEDPSGAEDSGIGGELCR